MKTALLVALVVTASLGCRGATARPESGQSIKLGILPMGTTQQYWQAVHAGASRAAAEHDVDLLWPTAFRDGDVSRQIEEALRMRQRGAAGLAIAPSDPTALVATVDDLMADGMQMIVFDSRLSGRDDLPFIGSNSHEAGQRAAEHMAAVLGGRGDLIVVRTDAAAVGVEQRVQGFLDTIATYPGMRVVSADHYVGSLLEGAYAQSHVILKETGAREPGRIAGIFTPNETTTVGMLRALENFGLTGRIHLVGFDASPLLGNLLRRARLTALVVQDPDQMGYLSVAALANLVRRSAEVEPRRFLPVTVATPQTADEPHVRRLLDPVLTLEHN